MAKFFTPTKLSENMHETPEGFLLCIGVPIARTGEQVYGEGETPLETADDGTIIIVREADEVFSPYTIASYEGKDVTIRHPLQFVDPKNWLSLSKGHIQNVRKGTELDSEGNEQLLADVLIKDSTAINLVKNGLREVSCGYDAEYEQIKKGRGRQTKILGNHLALVDKGRAGSSYAIMDHERKGLLMTFKERFKLIFGMTLDEAMKEDKSKDESTAEKKDESKDESASEKKDEKTDDEASMDAAMQMMKDAMGMMEKMSKGKDESEKKDEDKKDEKKDEKKDDAKDEGGETASLESRITALEMAVEKLLAASTSDEEEKKTDDEEEESKDDDFEESSLTGDEDTLARAEILSPGIKQSKDIKVQALKAAYATDEGKRYIKALNGGKEPKFESSQVTDSLFISASEVLKAKRGTGLEGTKNPKKFNTEDNGTSNVMTAEKMNEINAKYYGLKQ